MFDKNSIAGSGRVERGATAQHSNKPYGKQLTSLFVKSALWATAAVASLVGGAILAWNVAAIAFPVGAAVAAYSGYKAVRTLYDRHKLIKHIASEADGIRADHVVAMSQEVRPKTPSVSQEFQEPAQEPASDYWRSSVRSGRDGPVISVNTRV